jgi:N-methylhydantoinase A/oxoprolinase/acetone carboxylase beta subunit
VHNGFARLEDPVEVVTVRAESVGKPILTWADLPEVEPSGVVDLASRVVVTGDGEATARVINRYGLAAGDEVIGPAVIEEREATTYLGPGERAVVDASGALEVEW